MGLTRHEQIISIPASMDYLIVQAILSVKMTVDVRVSRSVNVVCWLLVFIVPFIITNTRRGMTGFNTRVKPHLKQVSGNFNTGIEHRDSNPRQWS